MDRLKTSNKTRFFRSTVLSLFCYGSLAAILSVNTANAGVSGDGYWVVEKGDSVYSIARKVFPDDKDKQRQFRKELVDDNAAVFNGKPGHIRLGARLQLPAFATAKPVDVQPPSKQHATQDIPIEKAPIASAPMAAVTPDPEEVIGRVVVSVGKMQASNRGSFRALMRNSKVFKGDTLTTASSAYTQIRMKDGALISLRPNTKLVIKEYNYNGREDGSEKSFMELLQGGFRTITGYIGHKNKSNYRVRTSVATIGIRGTHYGLMVCEAGSCANEETPLEDGVYGGVVDGSIQVENSSGSYTFNNDQYFHVASDTSPAVEQLVPPPVFYGKSEKMIGKKTVADQSESQSGKQGKNGDMKDGTARGQATNKGKFKSLTAGLANKKTGARMGSLVMAYVESQPPMLVLPDQINDAISEAPKADVAPDGSVVLISIFDTNPDGSLNTTAASIQVNSSSNGSILLGSKQLPDGRIINNVPVAIREQANGNTYELLLPSGSVGIGNSGGDPIGVNWGRWDADYKFSVNNNPVATKGPLHYVYSDQMTTPAELAQLTSLGGLVGVQTYDLVGGTTPTTISGASANLLGLTVTSDFQKQEIISYDIQVNVTGAPADLNMSAQNIPFDAMADINLTDPSGCPLCSGRAAAAFVGAKAEGLITTYSIVESSSGEGVNGAAALKR